MTSGAGEDLFKELLKKMVEVGASDLHLKAGLPPVVRHHSSLRLLSRTHVALSASQIVAICMDIIPENLRAPFAEGREIDLAYGYSGVGRFRLNIFRHRSQVGIISRFIPFEIKTLEDLGLPPACKELALRPRGLVLVTGPAGSGKSTTVAAMLNEWNRSRGGHIITIEDPIEFLIRDRKSIVTQREIGIDTESFHTGLKFALRQDPDVIMIGELRDRESVEVALNASETGHLVLATLHTRDAAETMGRVLGVFPPDAQPQIRQQLASVLSGIISQRLIPKKQVDGADTGLCLAAEVLVNSSRVKEILLDPTKSALLKDAIENGAQHGMQSFDQALMKLMEAGLINKDTALENASSASDFELKTRGIRQSASNWRE